MKKIFVVLLMVAMSSMVLACGKNMKIDVTTVSKVDLNRYLGKWYEIARFDHSFEKGLVATTAEYALKDNGKISVTNSGRVGSLDGKLKVAHGKAKIPNPNEPGKLKVAFFLWFYADYFILELDEVDYSYALIGSKSDDYLWILSRTPKMDKNVLDMLLEKAKDRGYDISKLIFVEQ